MIHKPIIDWRFPLDQVAPEVEQDALLTASTPRFAA
jgi:hypothetical protein